MPKKEVNSLQDITSLITVASFIGGIAIFLFKKIVIEPLQKSIDSLNNTLKEFKINTEKRMDLLEHRVDMVEDHSSRQEEQIKSIFKTIEGR